MEKKISKEKFLLDKFDKWYEYLLPLLPDKDYPLFFEDILEKRKEDLC
jgi:hypothetical protein